MFAACQAPKYGKSLSGGLYGVSPAFLKDSIPSSNVKSGVFLRYIVVLAGGRVPCAAFGAD
jgi:hypothetical protein